MSSIVTAPVAAPVRIAPKTYTFYNAVEGVTIKVAADDYLAALPKLLATVSAKTAEGLTLADGDAAENQVHDFVAGYGASALSDLCRQRAGK